MSRQSPPALAARLAAERTARGWSLRAVAIKSGLSAMGISRAERGADVPVSTLAALADAYDLPVCVLMGRDCGHDTTTDNQHRGRQQ